MMEQKMSTKIKIMYVIGDLGLGGVERHLYNILSNIDKSKFDPYVCCLEKKGQFVPLVENMGIKIVDLKVKSLYTFKAIIALVRLIYHLKRNKIHIIHSYLLKSMVLGTTAALISRTNIIFNSRRDMGWENNKRQTALLNYTNKYSDCVIAVCEAVKIETLKKEKIDEKIIKVIYNGVTEIESFGKDRNDIFELRREFNLGENDQIISILTHMTPVKGNEYLIKAMPEIINKFPNTKLILIGGLGNLKQDLVELCQELHIENSVIFAGQRKDVMNILEMTDIYVCSSLSEGMSNGILEAMANGKPIIATNVGGNKELVKDGYNGYLVEKKNPADLSYRIQKLLMDSDMRDKFGKNSANIIKETFSINKMIQQTSDLYVDHYLNISTSKEYLKSQ